MPEINDDQMALRALRTRIIERQADAAELPSLLASTMRTTHVSPPCTPCTPAPPPASIHSPLSLPATPQPEQQQQQQQTEAFVFQPSGHPKQALIDGEIWPPIFKAEFVRSAKKLKALPTDVFVCTYPKCGTTWIQHICSQLMNDDYGPQVGKELCVTSPMIERMGGRFADNLTHPRLLKTHFTRNNCPKSTRAKYIYAVRNPKDCLTSYFFHNRNFKIYEWADGDYATFFRLFMNGRLGFGDYFDHLVSWLPYINDKNVLFLKYEDMVADLESAVRKIGHFLGGRAAAIVDHPQLLERVVRESRIDAMKQNQGRWFPGSVLRGETFIRKGGSRDWKNHMTKEQSDELDELFRRRCGETVAADWWCDEMRWSDDEEDTETVEKFDGAEEVSEAQLVATFNRCIAERLNALADALPPQPPASLPALCVTEAVEAVDDLCFSEKTSSEAEKSSASTSGCESPSSASFSGASSRRGSLSGATPPPSASYLALRLLAKRQNTNSNMLSLPQNSAKLYGGERRGSAESIASSGYGSIHSSMLSLNNN